MRSLVCEGLRQPQSLISPEQFLSLQESRPDAYSNLRLLRVLRKSKLQDAEACAERFLQYLQWREVNRVNDLMVDRNVAKFCKRAFGVSVVGGVEWIKDENAPSAPPPQQSSVTVYLNVGDWKTKDLMEELKRGSNGISVDSFLQYWISIYEDIHFRLHDLTLANGRNLAFANIDADMGSISLSQFSPKFMRRVGGPWMTTTQSHYPETTNKIFFRNAPTVINVVWKVVGVFVSEGTKVGPTILHQHDFNSQDANPPFLSLLSSLLTSQQKVSIYTTKT
jgi:hypothetical protein